MKREPLSKPENTFVRIVFRGLLRVEVHGSASLAAVAAADRIASLVNEAASDRGVARVVFAAAPSQAATLEVLRHSDVIWERVEAFHLDEYVGLGEEHPSRFGAWLRRHLFDAVPLRAVYLMNPDPDPAAECDRYAGLLLGAPIDLVVAGIGENGHLAFNDPPADFAETRAVKIVELDTVSRRQQVNDRQFADLDAVPRRAITMTIPALLAGRSVACVVSGPRKRAAVTSALGGPISSGCPASSLRSHRDAVLYLDPDAAPEELAT